MSDEKRFPEMNPEGRYGWFHFLGSDQSDLGRPGLDQWPTQKHIDFSADTPTQSPSVAIFQWLFGFAYRLLQKARIDQQWKTVSSVGLAETDMVALEFMRCSGEAARMKTGIARRSNEDFRTFRRKQSICPPCYYCFA